MPEQKPNHDLSNFCGADQGQFCPGCGGGHAPDNGVSITRETILVGGTTKAVLTTVSGYGDNRNYCGTVIARALEAKKKSKKPTVTVVFDAGNGTTSVPLLENRSPTLKAAIEETNGQKITSLWELLNDGQNNENPQFLEAAAGIVASLQPYLEQWDPNSRTHMNALLVVDRAMAQIQGGSSAAWGVLHEWWNSTITASRRNYLDYLKDVFTPRTALPEETIDYSKEAIAERIAAANRQLAAAGF